MKSTFSKLPGWIASVLMIGFTALWTFWGIGEMYHEGWWGAWYNRLPYLIPIAATLIPTLLAFRWPLASGILIMAIGTFTFFFFGFSVAYIGLAIAMVGGAFVADGVIKRRKPPGSDAESPLWWRQWRYRLAIGGPLLIFLVMSLYQLPIVLTRKDDGSRDARLISGNEVNLVWAPQGPGWNWKQPWGGHPSWQDIALYGVAPVGLGDKPGYGRIGEEEDTIVFATEADMAQTNLCLYLNPAGTALMAEPQYIWRIPTTDEVVRSLGRHGENAGCSWQVELGLEAACDYRPDKETPLWAPDLAVIYYWTAESYNERDGYFVAYNGTVNATYKLGGNPRHGYRCVKEP